MRDALILASRTDKKFTGDGVLRAEQKNRQQISDITTSLFTQKDATRKGSSLPSSLPPFDICNASKNRYSKHGKADAKMMHRLRYAVLFAALALAMSAPSVASAGTTAAATGAGLAAISGGHGSPKQHGQRRGGQLTL